MTQPAFKTLTVETFDVPKEQHLRIESFYSRDANDAARAIVTWIAENFHFRNSFGDYLRCMRVSASGQDDVKCQIVTRPFPRNVVNKMTSVGDFTVPEQTMDRPITRAQLDFDIFERVEIIFTHTFDARSVRGLTKAGWVEYIQLQMRLLFRDLFIHEMEESLVFDGHLPFDPHRGGK